MGFWNWSDGTDGFVLLFGTAFTLAVVGLWIWNFWFVPRGTKVSEEIAAVCEASVDTALIESHWNSLVRLAASVMSGHASEVTALARST